jgi:hypothetical protein
MANRKTEFRKKLMISKRNRERKSVKVAANEVYTAKFENRITYEGKRECD